MKKSKIKIAILILGVLGVFVFITNFSTKTQTSLAQTRNSQVKEIEGYKKWTKVNTTPQLMPDIVAMSCILYTSPKGEEVDPRTNPHLSKYITVYVNNIGRKTMLGKRNQYFPGSVIVKEASKRNQPNT